MRPHENGQFQKEALEIYMHTSIRDTGVFLYEFLIKERGDL